MRWRAICSPIDRPLARCPPGTQPQPALEAPPSGPFSSVQPAPPSDRPTRHSAGAKNSSRSDSSPRRTQERNPSSDARLAHRTLARPPRGRLIDLCTKESQALERERVSNAAEAVSEERGEDQSPRAADRPRPVPRELHSRRGERSGEEGGERERSIGCEREGGGSWRDEVGRGNRILGRAVTTTRVSCRPRRRVTGEGGRREPRRDGGTECDSDSAWQNTHHAPTGRGTGQSAEPTATAIPTTDSRVPL